MQLIHDEVNFSETKETFGSPQMLMDGMVQPINNLLVLLHKDLLFILVLFTNSFLLLTICYQL